MRRCFASLRGRSLRVKWAVLLGAVLAVYLVVAPVAFRLGGTAGLAAAAVAAGLCLAGAGSALVVCHHLHSPENALRSLAIGMLLRMGIPLFSAVGLQFQGGPLAKAGLLIYLLVFYPVTLWVETLLSLPSDKPRAQAGSLRRNTIC